jgi:hypothetical protein
MIQITYIPEFLETDLSDACTSGHYYGYGLNNGDGQGSGNSFLSPNRKGNGHGMDYSLTLYDELGHLNGDGESRII